MRSFFKATRSTLSLVLALCMVFTVVTVSADGQALLDLGEPVDLEDGWFEVEAEVSGIAGDYATILVYTGAAPTSETIAYVNQAAVDVNGAATFTMEIPEGEYTVLGGGSGVAASTPESLSISSLIELVSFAAPSAINDKLQGTALASLGLPTSIVGTTADGTVNLPVVWTTSSYNANLTTTQTFAGTIDFDGYDTSGLASTAVSISVTLIPVITIVGIVAPANITSYNVGTTYAELELPETVTGKDAALNEYPLSVTWTTPTDFDPDSTQEQYITGSVQFTETRVADPDNLALGFVTVSVILQPNTITIVDIDAPAAISNKPIGTTAANLGLPTTVTGYDYGENEYELGVLWSDLGYNSASLSPQTITGAVVFDGSYVKDSQLSGTVTVTVTLQPHTVTAVNTPAAITNKFVGTAFGSLGLPTHVSVSSTGGGQMISVTWDAEDYDSTSVSPQTISGTVNFPATHVPGEGVSNQVTISVTLQTPKIAANANLGTVYVTPYALYDDIFNGEVVPDSYTVTLDSGSTVEASIIWPDELTLSEGIPLPYEDEGTAVVTGEFADGEGFLADGKEVTVTLVFAEKAVAVTVDGYANKKTVYSRVGEDVVIEASYTAADNVEYAFKFIPHGQNVPAAADEDYSSDATFVIDKADELFSAINDAGMLVVYARGDDGVVVRQITNLYKLESLFTVEMYVNPSEANPKYSVLRANTNTNMNVAASITSRNGDTTLAASLTPQYSIQNAAGGTLVAPQASAQFTSAQLMPLSTASSQRRVVVDYLDEDDNVVAGASRTVIISPITFWYNSVVISGKSAGTPRIKKANGIDLVLTFDSQVENSGEDIYANTVFLPLNTAASSDPTDYEEGFELVNDRVYEKHIDTSEAASGTYRLHMIAVKDTAQSYYDMAISRPVYIQTYYTNIYTISSNGLVYGTAHTKGAPEIVVAPVSNGDIMPSDVAGASISDVTVQYRIYGAVGYGKYLNEGAAKPEPFSQSPIIDLENDGGVWTLVREDGDMPNYSAIFMEIDVIVDGVIERTIAKAFWY